MRYASVRARQAARDDAWRAYVAESLHVLPQGAQLRQTWAEFTAPPAPPDNRTGDEIAADIIERMGLEVVR